MILVAPQASASAEIIKESPAEIAPGGTETWQGPSIPGTIAGTRAFRAQSWLWFVRGAA